MEREMPRYIVQATVAFLLAGTVGFLGRGGAAWFPHATARAEAGTGGDASDDPTPTLTETAYFKPDSPQRHTFLEPGLHGKAITITGRVLTPSCTPVEGALLEFWQADERGQYDVAGNRLRGHQYTDESGRFSLTTIVPGASGGRTRHINVRVIGPDGEVLTTALFFPGEPRNRADRSFRPELQVDLQDGPAGKIGAFDFVLSPRAVTKRVRFNV